MIAERYDMLYHGTRNILIMYTKFVSPQCRIYASMNQVSIGSDSGLSPFRRQAIIWTRAGLLSIGPLGTNFSEILTKIQNFSVTKMHLKISSDGLRKGGHFFQGTWVKGVAIVTSIRAHNKKKPWNLSPHVDHSLCNSMLPPMTQWGVSGLDHQWLR